MMNKISFKSILTRFFFMNITILIILVSIQLLAQGLFYEKFYIEKKENEIEKELNDFTLFLDNLEGDEESKLKSTMEYITKINEDKKIDISIREKDMSTVIEIDKYMNKNYLLLHDENTNKEYKVVVGDFLSGILLNYYDKVKITGIKDKYGYVIPKKIYINNDLVATKEMDVALLNPFNEKHSENNSEEDSEKYKKLQQSVPITINGVVLDETLQNNDLVILKNTLMTLDDNLTSKMVRNESITIFENLGEENNEYIISSKKRDKNFIIAISQLSDVNEFISGMDKFYFNLLLFILPIIAIISFIYSRFITKPLISMSKIAKEIANSNFNAKYPIKSKDEIGELGNSLNEIGDNLEKALDNLNEKIKLQEFQQQNRKELIDNISHELKTPLTIIDGRVQGFKKGIYKEDVLEDILEETSKMNKLLGEMLEISRLEDPSFTFKKQLFDLNALVLQELDPLRILFNHKSIILKVNIADNLQGEELVVLGDEEKIGEVIRNLLTNAIKYTQNGEKVIVTLSEDNEGYNFSVENFGVTLTEEEAKNIWEPFYRTEKSRNKKFGGSGLGLYFVKKILESNTCIYGVIVNKNSLIFNFTMKKHLNN